MSHTLIGQLVQGPSHARCWSCCFRLVFVAVVHAGGGEEEMKEMGVPLHFVSVLLVVWVGMVVPYDFPHALADYAFALSMSQVFLVALRTC